MGSLQEEISNSFRRVVNFIKESKLFSADTFSKDQVQAGLCKFAEETNWLLEGYDSTIQEERCNFFKGLKLNETVGQDEIFTILEQHEILMRKQFPNTYPSLANPSIGDAAFNKAKYITENIKGMSESTVEKFSHKFDQMIGAYPKPYVIVDNQPKAP